MAPNRPKHQKHSQAGAGGGSAPAFSQIALSQLTAKIDRDLESRNAKNLSGGKRKRDADAADEEADDNASRKGSKAHKKQEGASSLQPARSQHAKPQTNGSAKEKGPGKNAALLDEIKALGGDEGDLELVAGIDSDAEEGGPSGKAAPGDDLSLNDAFKSELAKFAAGLGFDEVREADEDDNAPEAEEEEGEDEVEEEGGDEDEDEDEEVDGEEGEVNNHEAGDELEVPQLPKMEAPKASHLVDPFLPKNPKFAKLMFEPRPDWHSVDLGVLPFPSSDDIGRLSSTVASLRAYADTLLESDAAAYKSIVSASSSHRFVSTIMSSGTMSDKVSALTLEVQEAPVHNMKTFENLVGLAGKRSRGQAIAALGALVDLLGNGVILPSDRRLRAFQTQPGLLGALQAAGPSAQSWKPSQKLPGAITKAHLMAWRYEDWLKDAFFQILQQLEVWCNDEIEYSRSRALDFVFGLLRNKPEQEANLLRLLVNKLGDRERKIASRASYLLLQLLNIHPGMKPIVVQTIEEEILLRPGQSLRAKYNGINTLNQTILSNKEPAVADTLVRVYFELFLALLKSGALGAIDIPGLESITKDAGGANLKTGRGPRRDRRDNGKKSNDKKTASSSKNEGIERDVSEKLVSALLTGVNRAIPFATTDNSTLEKHIDTLFRITHSSNFNTSIQALMLVQQVAVSKQLAVDRFYRTLYESLLDPRLVTSSKQAMYLNLLYRSLKNDLDTRRVKAFVKRMLQISTLHQPPFVCGILFLVAELETTFPDLKGLLNDPEMGDDDGEEYYRDVVEGEETNNVQETESSEKPRVVYDGRKRDPEYSNAERSCLWELIPYFKHFHPSVTAFASNLLIRQTSLPKPDMANHTLMHFLDKFVYRNPKTTDATKQRGISIMQPVAVTTPSTGAAQIVAPNKAAGSQQQVAINSAAFWGRKVEDVAAEDVFFHTYFAQIGKPAQTSRAAKRAAKQEEDSAAAAAPGEDGSDLEDAEEEEIWQALKGSRPEIEADDEDVDMDMDDDDDLSGLESLLGMSDSDEDESDEDEGGEDLDNADGESGGVEFADFSDEEDGDALAGGKANDDGLVSLGGFKQTGRMRRKELKALPTFASAEDYAEMLGADEDEDY